LSLNPLTLLALENSHKQSTQGVLPEHLITLSATASRQNTVFTFFHEFLAGSVYEMLGISFSRAVEC